MGNEEQEYDKTINDKDKIDINYSLITFRPHIK